MRGTRTHARHAVRGLRDSRGTRSEGVVPVSGNIFDKALGRATLFRNKEHLRHSHQPTNLPHRDREIEQLTFNLVEALNGQIPSNMILYGVTGAGKTAVTSIVCNQLVEKGRQIDRDVFAITVNCRQIDTQYRVLTHLGNSMLEAHEVDEIPFTGWPTDRVLGELVRRMEKRAGVYIIVLDEIDHLVRKAGDDLLYNLTNLNSSLKAARCCVIGISNDLKFTDFLDPRVRSRLGQQDVVFNPYDADQLRDILVQRSSSALHPEALEDGVIGLCAALAAQEHGDARCALDLLRVSAEKAEHEGTNTVAIRHVRTAQSQIEADQITPVVHSLPTQQKLVLSAVLLTERSGARGVQTGEVYDVYDQACHHVGKAPLTARRVSMLISNLDMLGLITARTVSRGRYGRTKEIHSSLPPNVDAAAIIQASEPDLEPIFTSKYRHQSRL